MFEIQNYIRKKSNNKIYLLSDDWINIDLSEPYKGVLYSSLEYSKPEMFFYSIYKLITQKLQKENKLLSTNEIMEYYYATSSQILFEYCKVGIENNSYNFNKNLMHKLDIDFENYIIGLKKSILDYIMAIPRNLLFIGLLPDDIPHFEPQGEQFFQINMTIGFSIATSRIFDEINNTAFFGAEIVDYNQISNIIFYLTPYGIINIDEIKDIWKVKFEKFLIDNNFTIINSTGLTPN